MPLIGCASSPPAPGASTSPYEGPSLSLVTDESGVVVVAQAPTPGWTLRLDQIREGFDSRDVYVTIIRPDPTLVYPQMIVEQRLATTVRADEHANILARVIDRAAAGSSGEAYRRGPSHAPSTPTGTK